MMFEKEKSRSSLEKVPQVKPTCGLRVNIVGSRDRGHSFSRLVHQVDILLWLLGDWCYCLSHLLLLLGDANLAEPVYSIEVCVEIVCGLKKKPLL